MNYAQYQAATTVDIAQTIADLKCQPVLFAGTGLSIRYFGAPSWRELLEKLTDRCPEVDRSYGYYAQSCSSAPQIASIFAGKYRDWAWGSGQNSFAKELFDPSVSGDMFLKQTVAQIISSMTPSDLNGLSLQQAKEVRALSAMQPHAVLTTNYDKFLELIFPDFKPIVGQSALKGVPFTVGEIFKLHGCVDCPKEIVITQEDYAEFFKKKKFIAARLLSLFNEHPLLIVGYSAQDENVCALLADIDEALSLPGELIDNIYFLEYDPDAEKRVHLPVEKLIKIEANRSVRVKQIVASDFWWVFNAFKASETLNAVPAKFVRSILARSYELVRSDVPRRQLEVDFEFLERKLERTEDFAKLLGITTVADASLISAQYRFSITELGQALGGKHWHLAKKIIMQIKDETGFDIQSSDNIYHRKMKLNTSEFSQYSDEALKLLKRVQEAGRCENAWIQRPIRQPKLL